MKDILTLISTGIGVVDILETIIHEERSDIQIRNIVDDSVISEIASNGNVIPPSVVRRIATYCQFAEDIGSRAVLITCSSISEIVDLSKPFVHIPLFKIDEPMAELAVTRSHDSIAIVATLETTMLPTRRLVEAKAAAAGKQLKITEELCIGAFEARMRGDYQKHDQIVLTAVKNIVKHCDIVLLAQVSMARVIEGVSDPLIKDRVLTSPKIGIQRALEALTG